MVEEIPEDLVFRHFLRALKRNVAEQQRLDPYEQLAADTLDEDDPVLDRALAATSAERFPQDSIDTVGESSARQPLDRQGLGTSEHMQAAPQLPRELQHSHPGVEIGHSSDGLAEAVFRSYWQGFQHAADSNTQASKLQGSEQHHGSLNDPKLVSLLESWHMAGRTSGALIKDRESRAS